jgi:small-conductance mechanosensitive channel
LVFIIIATWVFIANSHLLIPGGIPDEIALIIGTIIGTVFALSTTTVVQNFVAGIFLIVTRPFKIGDYIRVGDQEGIVDEISLSHTKMLRRSGVHEQVSNLTIINSKITNFTISLDDYAELTGEYNINLKDSLFKKRSITRYAFTIEVPKEDPANAKAIFKKIADAYKTTYLKPPEFITTAYLHKIIVSVILISEDPEIIIQNKDLLVESIFMEFYSQPKFANGENYLK